MYYINVAINVPLPQVFIYASPQQVAVGVRVLVSFGSRHVLGFVTKQLTEVSNDSIEIKIITKIVDQEPLFDDDFCR